MQTYLQTAETLFKSYGGPGVAQQQMKYLRNQFAFFGLKTPELIEGNTLPALTRREGLKWVRRKGH